MRQLGIHKAALALVLVAVVSSASCTTVSTLSAQLERALDAGEPVEGDIHGAYPGLDQYVFTYRSRDDFFESVDVSLIAATPEVAGALAGLRRHDRVRIMGERADNRSQQMHVEVRALDVVAKYAPTPDIPPYDHAADLPSDLNGKDSELFLVHAVAADGAVLVVEREDVVLPVYVRRPAVARDLARNDVVRLNFAIRAYPDRPVHIELADVARPIEVVDSITALHGRAADVEGALVLFPQSPQTRFNVFAVLEELPGGLKRQFTLANFDDPAVFEAIRTKLQAAWDAAGPAAASNGRNKLVSTLVRVRARGVFNQIDPGQANAQIVLAGPADIEIVSR